MQATQPLPAETKPKTLSPACCNLLGVGFVIVAAAGVLASTVGYDAVSEKLHDGLRAHYVLDSPSAGAYADWVDTSRDDSQVLIYTDYYVYNITNAWDFVHGAKPIVQEVGPIRYMYKQKKLDVEWDEQEGGDVLSYVQWQYYVPADDASAALAELNVTSIYVPLLGALASPAGRALLAFSAYTDPMALLVNRSMKEIIYGWEDPLLKQLGPLQPQLPSRYPGIQTNDSSADVARARHKRNRMYTGLRTANLAREFLTWDGMDDMLCCAYGPCGDSDSGNLTAGVRPWHTDAAEQMQGVMGDTFKMDVQTDETLRVSTHGFGILRWWPLVHTGTYDVRGVPVHKRQLPEGILGNDTVSPEEALAYDIHGPSGLLNQSQCEWGAPVYMSRPLFLGGSDSLRDAIVGLGEPNPAVHDTFLGVEPTTGQTLDFHVRVSASIRIEPTAVVIPGLVNTTFFGGVRPLFFPILWADRFGTANDDQIAMFKNQVMLARNVMAGLRWGGIGVAISAGVTAAVFAYIATVRRRLLEEQREVGAADYYAQFYAPFLSEDARGAMGPPLNGDARGYVAAGARGGAASGYAAL